jgi:signal peptidase I
MESTSTTRAAAATPAVSPAAWAGRPARRLGWGDAAFALGLVALVLVWAAVFRPERLGGSVDYVMVRGVSMEPAFHTGDLVVVRRQASYRRGDVVAYRVPDGEVGAGATVFHRIVGGSPRQGFETKGDNNPTPDDWYPRPRDILGGKWLLIPKAGNVLAFLHDPLPLASLAMGVTVALIAVPARKKKRRS